VDKLSQDELDELLETLEEEEGDENVSELFN
jgi:flagellar motor switch protein FliM